MVRDTAILDGNQIWDAVVVGGGITGAGIFHELVNRGARTLLVEQRDFGWGTSSRSSKLVHGGLRYLKEGNPHLTFESVRERQFLLNAAPGLVEPIDFVSLVTDSATRWAYSVGLALYDAMAAKWNHRYFAESGLINKVPAIIQGRFIGAFQYGDAQTDDARLTYRVLQDGIANGGVALNYVQVVSLIQDGDRVTGVELQDCVSQKTYRVACRVVVNATGAWADHLRQQVGADKRMRPLRGSHLAFLSQRLPVSYAVSVNHPADGRPVFILPWETMTVVGTTDVDDPAEITDDPAISADEVAYLMQLIDYVFPALKITRDDVISTWAGVRPTVNTGKADPSKETRDHAIWDEKGLITVTGGKLTTFHVVAAAALKAIQKYLPNDSATVRKPLLPTPQLSIPEDLGDAMKRRLIGRYGAAATSLLHAAQPGELETIAGTPYLWAELRWAARAEHVVHLDDLLLRRVRLGLMLPQGGKALIERIRQICQPELGWDDARWHAEQSAYFKLWARSYSLPLANGN